MGSAAVAEHIFPLFPPALSEIGARLFQFDEEVSYVKRISIGIGSLDPKAEFSLIEQSLVGGLALF